VKRIFFRFKFQVSHLGIRVL